MISFLKKVLFSVLVFAIMLFVRASIQYDYPFKMGDFLGHTSGQIQQEAINRVKKAFIAKYL